MKKTLIIFLLIFSVIFFSGSLFAKTPTPTPDSDIQSSYTMECLSPPEGIGTTGILGDSYMFIHGSGQQVFTMTLSGQCSQAAGCDLAMCVIGLGKGKAPKISIGQGVPRIQLDHSNEKCTTGNSAKDLYYFGQDFTSITTSYLTAPALTDNHINPGPVVNLEVTINNRENHLYYSFYAVGKTGGTLLPTVTGGLAPTVANNNTQQIGLVTGSSQQQTNLVAGEQGKCQTIYWDPYGRVFDGISLEPLNKDEARVTLLNKDSSIVEIPGNNVSIDILGKYNILINKDGEYKLNVVPTTTHQFVNFIPDTRYKDLYESIFMLGDSSFFESASDPKRIDVALKPISTPYSRPIDVVQNDYKQVWTSGKKYIRIDLRVTHPKSIVKLIVNDIIVKDDGEGNILPLTTDKNGYWKIMVRDFKVLSQKGFRIEISKNPQYYMFASQTGNKIIIDFDPILSYVEGYAYDDNGSILSNAKIQVRLKMNDSIFYETQADGKGFFTIDPINLPPLDYYFVFVNPLNNQAIKKTTADFIRDNNSYLETAKINLLKGEKNGELVVKKNNKERDFSLNGVAQKNNLEKKSDSKTIKNNYSLLLSFVALIILIIGAGATSLYIFLKKPKVTS